LFVTSVSSVVDLFFAAREDFRDGASKAVYTFFNLEFWVAAPLCPLWSGFRSG